MSRLVWDKAGEKFYEAGVDHVALYLNVSGVYPKGEVWNGITNVTESPTGAESNKGYADNIPYFNLVSAEEVEGSISAYTYPNSWNSCNGYEEPVEGLKLGQQTRTVFGLVYRTKIGNDTDGQDHGYKLHLIWGALASPSEMSHDTINDSPDAMEMSWDFSTTPVDVPGYKPTSTMEIDSTKFTEAQMKALEDILYGTDATSEEATGTEARLPLPSEIITLMKPANMALRAARVRE